jgi:hypothetical protein
LTAILAFLRVFVAENLPPFDEAALQAARLRWDERGPASYDLDLEVRGAQPGTVHVEVRDGVPTASTRNGRPTPERTWDVWTVPGQFETLEREVEFAENPQQEMQAPRGARLWPRCEFDPEFGFARHYHRHATGGAPDMSWEITRFEPVQSGSR